MKVTKREVRDYDGTIDDTLYCINDDGKLTYSIDNYKWSISVESKKELGDLPAWALDNPYKNKFMETDLKDLMTDMYDELQPVRKRDKSLERE